MVILDFFISKLIIEVIQFLKIGQFMFTYKEYLKPIQIKGLIQRLMKLENLIEIDMDELEDNTIISDALSEIQESFEYSITAQKTISLDTEQIMYVGAVI